MDLFRWSYITSLSIYKNGMRFFSIPLIALIAIFLAAFWLLPVIGIVGLCAGYSYQIERV